MNKKYKELPAFETNEFKAGDIVRVYGKLGGGSDIGEVSCIDAERVFIMFKHFNEPSIYHFKQCRKLLKKEPRIIYLVLPIDGRSGFFNYCKEKIPEKYRNSAIKFMEVLEDEL